MKQAVGADLAALFKSVPVIPVLVIENASDAVPMARALVNGGLKVLEITLRTAAALTAVTAVREAVPGALVGVGSVIDTLQFSSSQAAGAQFAVSPGSNAELLAAARDSNLPWLPGAQTVSEVLALRSSGYRFLKFFPAHAAGGVNFLRAIRGPVPDMVFCPTGGISEATAPQYLALPNVACVGGSWLTPDTLVAARDWHGVEALARTATGLPRG